MHNVLLVQVCECFAHHDRNFGGLAFGCRHGNQLGSSSPRTELTEPAFAGNEVQEVAAIYVLQDEIEVVCIFISVDVLHDIFMQDLRHDLYPSIAISFEERMAGQVCLLPLEHLPALLVFREAELVDDLDCDYRSSVLVDGFVHDCETAFAQLFLHVVLDE